MAKPTARQLLLTLVKTIEEQYLENWAMRMILTECPNVYTRETWEADVQRFSQAEGSKKPVHALFAPIYALIDDVNDEAGVLALLAQVLAKGKPN